MMRSDTPSNAPFDRRLIVGERKLRAAAAEFLRAERASGDACADRSERALRSLFRTLPSPAPGADFALRVLASVPVRRVRDLAPGQRWLVAAAALCTALASAYTLPLLVLVVGQVRWGAVVADVGAALGHLVALAYGLAVFGRTVTSLLQALLLFLTSPEILLTLVVAAAIVGLCMRLLTELIHSPRDPAHASF